MKDKKAISIKTLNKSNVWDIQENDVIRMWEAAEKDADFKENLRHFKDIIKTAFEIEDVKIDKPVVIDKLEQRGFKVGTISLTTKLTQDCHQETRNKACHRPYLRERRPHLGDKACRGIGEKLRRRMGKLATKHTGHHRERV